MELKVIMKCLQKEQKEHMQTRLEMQEQLNAGSHELDMQNEILNALCEDYNSIYSYEKIFQYY